MRRRLRAGRAAYPVARPLGRPVGLPLDAKAGGTESLAEAQAQPAGALPRRFAPHTRPAREALARTGTTPRSHTETAS